MKNLNDQLARLLRSAAQVAPEEASAPFGFATRVMAGSWRAHWDETAGLRRLLRAALCGACVLLVVSAVCNFVIFKPTYTDELTLANSIISVDVLP
jgi:hypothetical protein